MAGMEVAEGALGLTSGPDPALTAISWSTERGSWLVGSHPCSARYFSMRRRSKICPETGEMTGVSGAWKIKIRQTYIIYGVSLFPQINTLILHIITIYPEMKIELMVRHDFYENQNAKNIIEES